MSSTKKDRLVSTPVSDRASCVSFKKRSEYLEVKSSSDIQHSFSIEIHDPMLKMERLASPDPHKRPCLGYSFMIMAVFGITLVHIFSKAAFTRNPSLTNVDATTFMGIWLALIYFIWANIQGVPLQLNGLSKRPLIAMAMSMVATVCCNQCMFIGISMISVGKSTLIFSTNPMFSMILAYFFINEKVTKAVIFSTIGAFIGIYFLSVNKNNVEDGKYVIIGILLVICGACFQAVIFVCVRVVSSSNIHFLVRPFYVGMTFIFFAILTITLHREGITFEQYDSTDVLLLTGVGIGSCICVGPLSIAMKYETASKLSPILYIENVFTLIADAVIFNYHFITADYIGIGLVSVCLCIPAFLKIKSEQDAQKAKLEVK